MSVTLLNVRGNADWWLKRQRRQRLPPECRHPLDELVTYSDYPDSMSRQSRNEPRRCGLPSERRSSRGCRSGADGRTKSGRTLAVARGQEGKRPVVECVRATCRRRRKSSGAPVAAPQAPAAVLRRRRRHGFICLASDVSGDVAARPRIHTSTHAVHRDGMSGSSRVPLDVWHAVVAPRERTLVPAPPLKRNPI